MNNQRKNLTWKNSSGVRKIFTKNPHNQEPVYWNPHKSKIAAALFNGLEIFPFTENIKIFYNDNDKSNNSVMHIQNIIGINGKIYFNKNEIYSDNELDIVYINTKNDDELIDILDYSNTKLKTNGFLFFTVSLNSNSINFLFKKIKQKNFSLIEEVNLNDYFKNSMMIIMQKN